tara:strand:- start:86979 stop:87845 length:867 start_codon:yes stop_codon:yes gene_type:complete
MSDQHTPNNGDQNQDQLMDAMIERLLGQSNIDDPTAFEDTLDADSLQAEMELAAAMIDLAAAESQPVELPSGLTEKLKSQIDQYAEQGSASTQAPVSLPIQDAPQPVITRIRWTPWAIAAASLLIATVAIIGRGPVPVPAPQDLGADRLALIAETPEGELTQWDWISTDDAAVVGEVIGDVVWSDTLNKGYMRISGLAINDPSLKQYQLWIFDATRASGDLPEFGDGLLSQRPIDGGVFDINAQGEVIIEIDAKLQVQQAAAFAITVEPPGGVVVSDRSRVPLLALAP